MASTDWLAVRAFLDLQQLQRVQGGGDLVAENLGELQILLAEGVGLGTLDVEGADDLVLKDQRYGQRTVRAGSAREIERIGGGVGAEIALAGGGDEAGDALALGLASSTRLAARGIMPS